jgi:hypothetical protein
MPVVILSSDLCLQRAESPGDLRHLHESFRPQVCYRKATRKGEKRMSRPRGTRASVKLRTGKRREAVTAAGLEPRTETWRLGYATGDGGRTYPTIPACTA